MNYRDRFTNVIFQFFTDYNDFYAKNQDAKEKKEILIKNSVFTEEVVFDNLSMSNSSESDREFDLNIKFEFCFFQKAVNFSNLNLKKNIEFKKCYFEDQILINCSKFFETFKLENCTCKKNPPPPLLISNSNFFSTSVFSFAELRELNFESGDFKFLQFEYLGSESNFLKKLKIDATSNNGIIKIGGETTFIQFIEIIGHAQNLSIDIDQVCVNVLNFISFKNEKSLRISRIIPFSTGIPSELSFYKCYLGKATFYSTDFSKFKEFKIYDTNLVETSYVNVNWDKKIFVHLPYLVSENQCTNDIYNKEYYLKEKENYRQLKFISTKQGDYLNEQFFRSKEILSYYSALSWYKWSDIGPKLVIIFSKWTSNFGLNIFRPFIFQTIIHFLLFGILIGFGFYQSLHFSICNCNWNAFNEANKEYLYLINPFRKFDSDFTGYFIVIDFLMRICSLYMLYNFVRASRRFIK